MSRALKAAVLSCALSSCAGAGFSDVNDHRSLEYRAAVPAITVNLDADCKVTSQVVSIPGPPRYISFRSGLGKADTSVDFGPGGTIAKFNSKTEGQVDDALKIATAVMSAARAAPAMVEGGKGASEGPKCKPTAATYLIDYDSKGRPNVNLNAPLFLKSFDEQSQPSKP
jgi:hypothetical protein